MTDVVVHPEGPLARGTDRRAKIRFEPGGSAANQAAWLAAFGVAVDFVARVGSADFEAETARLAEAGVTPHLVGDPERPTGRLVALIDPSGERSFFTDRAANEALTAEDVPDALIDNAAQVHLSGYSFFAPSPRAAAIDVMRRAGKRPVSVDPASSAFLLEAGPKAFLDWTRGAALLMPNADEAEVLTGSADPDTQCARLSALYPLVVIKRGPSGCVAAEGARRWRVDAPAVKAIDATGAGDAFAAAFLAARLHGAEAEAALQHAVAAGAKATTRIGGRPATADLRAK
jgi:sugar/nucleoside kinase (ribokinase family)